MAKKVTIHLSDELFDVFQIRKHAAHFRSDSEYGQALIREDARNRPSHHPADQWAAMTAQERYRLDESLLELVRTQPSPERSTLEAEITAAIIAFADREGKAAELASRLITLVRNHPEHNGLRIEPERDRPAGS